MEVLKPNRSQVIEDEDGNDIEGDEKWKDIWFMRKYEGELLLNIMLEAPRSMCPLFTLIL